MITRVPRVRKTTNNICFHPLHHHKHCCKNLYRDYHLHHECKMVIKYIEGSDARIGRTSARAVGQRWAGSFLIKQFARMCVFYLIHQTLFMFPPSNDEVDFSRPSIFNILAFQYSIFYILYSLFFILAFLHSIFYIQYISISRVTFET